MREGRARAVGVRFMIALVACAASACVSVEEDATGRDIYEQVCARCHGLDLGGGVGPALGPGSDVADQPDEYYVQTITRGRGRMPGFRSTLDEAQIARVIDYLRSEQNP